ISIHAPSRERHIVTMPMPKQILISIHAPSRERLLKDQDVYAIAYFNPRSLTGATASKQNTSTFI
ncbi:hypothetical protein, partial [Phascolarctobacterium succinatutens]|uniref:hypothetical protein n=1 Tax=Phascolarctobacterium succinatutens TaxID=626940 RepID=UPI003F56F394